MSTSTSTTRTGTTPPAARHWNARRLAHLLLIIAGIAVAVFGVARVADPHVTCREVVMHPGDVCHKNDYSSLGSEEVQSYEQRLHAARLSQPVVIVTGLGMAAFGGLLLRQENGRRREQD